MATLFGSPFLVGSPSTAPTIIFSGIKVIKFSRVNLPFLGFRFNSKTIFVALEMSFLGWVLWVFRRRDGRRGGRDRQGEGGGGEKKKTRSRPPLVTGAPFFLFILFYFILFFFSAGDGR